MTVFSAILLGLVMGVVFGFCFEKAKVFEPGVILSQMLLKEHLMLKVFLTAIATGAVVLAALHGFGFIKLYPKPFVLGANLIGGGLLGVGIVIAGACPGTVMAQIGAGYRDAIYTLLGGVLGAVTFSYARPSMNDFLAGGSKVTLPDMWGVPYWQLALALAALLAVIVVLLEKRKSWTAELGKNLDGWSD